MLFYSQNIFLVDSKDVEGVTKQLAITNSNIFSPGIPAHKARWALLIKIWENRPEALRVGRPGVVTVTSIAAGRRVGRDILGSFLPTRLH